jgi:hypothetical protein
MSAPQLEPTITEDMLRDAGPGIIVPMPEAMTLRDRFAAAALPMLPSMLSHTRRMEVSASEVAKYVYDVADAMLKERDRNAD